MSSQDPYATLGVARSASPDEIKSAYRKLARQYHPDVNPNNPEAEEKFKEISQAYAILGDAEKKARFDQFGTVEEPGFGGGGGQGDFFQGGGFGDLFEAFFGGQQAQPRARGGARDGDDLRAEAIIQLVDVLEGKEVPVKFRKASRCETCSGSGTSDGSRPSTCSECQGRGSVTAVRQTMIGSIRTSTPCPKCRGEGITIENPCSTCRGEGVTPVQEELFVTIPPGIEDGQTLRVQGKGSDGIRGGSNGDLYVVVHVAEDKRFIREGRNLGTEVEITYAQAAIGDVIAVEGLTENLELNIEPGTQPGDTFRIKNQGFPRIGGGPRGDLFVEAKIIVPKKTSQAEANLLKEYAELRSEPVPQGPGKSSNIFEKIFKRK